MDTEFRLRLDDRVYVLPPGETLIGRDPACLVQLSDDLVSRHHARLTVGEAQVLFEDLDSANGSRVNEEPVVLPVALRAGDRLRVGMTVLELQLAPRAQLMTPTLRLVLCPSCGAVSAHDLSFCAQCGHRLDKSL